MGDLDWTTISADIAAALDFVAEHGGELTGASHTAFSGSSVFFYADESVIRSIGGSWESVTAAVGWVAIKTEIAGVTLRAHCTDPAVIKAYPSEPTVIDWSE